MSLITAVVLVVGLTACGSTAIPEPTPKPTPVPEVTLRRICVWQTKKEARKTVYLPLIDGELPDTTLTMADMYFNVPEGMAVTYDDIYESRDLLWGIYREFYRKR